LQQVKEGRGATALITGSAGIGKTSMLRWLEGEAPSYGMTVRWGYCFEGIVEPFFPLEQVFRSSANRERVEPIASSSHPFIEAPSKLPLLAQFAVNRRKGVGTPIYMTPFLKSADDKRPSSVTRAPATVLLEYLSALRLDSASSPYLLLLDDFHWADADSVQALKFLSRNLRSLNVLMAVALREDEVRDPPFLEVLSDLRREGLVTDIHLEGLKEKEAQQLLESVAQAPFDSTKVETPLRILLERTGGNPYFFLESARQLRDKGLIRTVNGQAVLDLRSGDGSGRDDLGVPPIVSDLLSKRLLALSREERELLEGAALLGMEFEPSPLANLTHISGDSVTRMLHALSMQQGMLLPKPGNENHYTFVHSLLWETVRDFIPAAKRQELSARLASWWEAHHPADVERIMTLYHDGGVGEKALQWTEKAISLSLQAHGYPRVAKYVGVGLNIMEEGRAPIEDLCHRLMELNPPEPLSWELMLALVWSARDHNERKQLFAKLRDAVNRQSQLSTPTILGNIATIHSRILLVEGKMEEAEKEARSALSLLPDSEVYLRGHACYTLGWIFSQRNLWDEADKSIQQGLNYVKAKSALGLRPYFLSLEGLLATDKGDLTRAEEALLESTELSRNLGRVNMLVNELSNLSFVMGDRGNLEGAEEKAREALHVAEAFDLPTAMGAAMQALGRSYLRRHDYVAARKYFEMGLRTATEHGYLMSRAYIRLDLAETKGSFGDAVGALKDLEDVEKEGGLQGDQVATFLLLRATFSIDTGAKEQAKADVERVLADSRQRNQRYWEGRALLVMARWEARFGSTSDTSKVLAEAEAVLKECGVLDVAFLTGGSPGRDAKSGERVPPKEGTPGSSLEVLMHLARNGGAENAIKPDDVAPASLTQKGISEALGLTKSSLSTILKHLAEKGLVTGQTRRVTGITRRTKVYLLTSAGTALANSKGRDRSG
jgi:tetratricopeptide (TPR) repeat protein